ncbi:hypothetical protein [Acinetobacter brisouii]
MIKRTLFALGQVVFTPNALRFAEAEHIDLLALLVRHQSGDWGEISDEDRESNEEALLMPLRIMSIYKFSNDKIWIITEADRSVTTILLPSDY